MLAGVMLGGQAGPFASAQARSRALMLPTAARPAERRGASQSAAQPGAIGSAAQRGAMTSMGSAAASTSGGEAECNGSSDSTQLYTDVIRIPMILRCTLVQ